MIGTHWSGSWYWSKRRIAKDAFDAGFQERSCVCCAGKILFKPNNSDVLLTRHSSSLLRHTVDVCCIFRGTIFPKSFAGTYFPWSWYWCTRLWSMHTFDACFQERSFICGGGKTLFWKKYFWWIVNTILAFFSRTESEKYLCFVTYNYSILWKALIAAGADVAAQESTGHTSLILACENSHSSVAEVRSHLWYNILNAFLKMFPLFYLEERGGRFLQFAILCSALVW